MAATFFGGEVKYTKRYRLGQLLSTLTRHFLLMTATPLRIIIGHLSLPSGLGDMSESGQERRNLPAVIEPHLPAVIPPRAPTLPPPERPLPWLIALALGVIGLLVYALFFRSHHTEKTEKAEPPPGWDELSSCTVVRSFDGTRWLSFSDDKSVELLEALPSERRDKGEWSYDEESKKYLVTINGVTISYSLFSQQGVPG